jgi:HEAT repeat protein
VRAAAVGACVEAFGDSALAELLLQLDREPSVEVQCAVLRAVARRGLPEPSAELKATAGDELEERWIQALLHQAFDHPSGTVRVAAMRALARVAGRDHGSLREEDWQAWDRERRAASAAAEPTTP